MGNSHVCFKVKKHCYKKNKKCVCKKKKERCDCNECPDP
jgi:hypothetical protein